jgi:aminoglycoside phosphotransferase (APT) family kinase protein
MGSRDETIALWCEVSGKSAADIGWYEAFACLKMECLALRMMALRGMQLRAEPGTGTARLLERLG